MILLVNGAFGVGKTTIARKLVSRLPRAVLYDPEIIGMILQRILRGIGREVTDFQDLRSWRRLTILALRFLRLWFRNVVVPMAFSNVAYLNEIRDNVAVTHVCLVAPFEVVKSRLSTRRVTARDAAWQLRRAEECCAVHGSEAFAIHIRADRDIDAITDEILTRVPAS